MKAGTEAVIFDFDGTLVDATEAICTSFNSALDECGLGEVRVELIRSMIGRPLTAMFAAVAPGAAGEEIPRLLAAYRRVFWPRSLELTRLQPGVRSMLAAFPTHLKAGIATSRTAAGARHILDGFGLTAHFPAVVGIEHVKCSKPHPEPIVKALELLDVSPQRGVMVGDTVDDVGAGLAAGVKTIGITTGAHSRQELVEAGAHRVIDDLTRLPELLGLNS